MSTIVPFANEDPEALFVCPYYNNHVVRACRFNQHLRKCRRGHGGDGFKICCFNESHHVEERLYEKHIKETCPDKNVIKQDVEEAKGIAKHVLPQVEHFPQWQKPAETEDWETEAQDHLNLLQAAEELSLQESEEEIVEEITLLPERPNNWDNMSATQRKNYRRRFNRQQQKILELGLTPESFKKSENPEDWTEGERDAKIKAILSAYPPPTGKIQSEFIDFKSVLNQYCQKNKINAPKYTEVSAGTMFGGFAFEVDVNRKIYRSRGMQRTKKDAAHNAAKWALLAMELPKEEMPISKPRPIRSVSELSTLRQAHEVGLLHQAGQLPSSLSPVKRQSSPVKSQPSPVKQPSVPSVSFHRPSLPEKKISEAPNLMTPASFQRNSNLEESLAQVSSKKSAGRGRGRGTALAQF